ncbi:MAG: clostripain-related cysteine peptidase [Candidatus Wallbacteria bacterium]|nr:clostripain-related cysteine peptidase [Candidatus Wallbacteria bacterium]
MRFWLFLLILTSIPALCADSTTTVAKWSAWTVMIWMDGDNNLEPYAIRNMNQIEKGFVEDRGLRVVVQLDRITGYDTSNGNWTDTRRFLIKHDSDEANIGSTMLQDMGEINMGSGTELNNFISYCVTNFPARKYMLILWDHGYGWIDQGLDTQETDVIRTQLVRSVCADSTNRDELTLTEIYNSLSFFKERTGQKLDILGFDACLMQMLEVAYQFEPWVDYIVGSELPINVNGWPYEKLINLPCFNMGIKPLDFAKAITQYFNEYYATAGVGSSTLSCLATKNLNETAGLVSQLGLALYTYYDKTAFGQIIPATTYFISDTWDSKIRHYYVDLCDFTDQIAANATYSTVYPAVKNICNAVRDQITDGTATGETKDGTLVSTFTDTHLVNLYIYRDPYKTNQISPAMITQVFPKNFSIYQWDKTSVNFSFSFISTNPDFKNNIMDIKPAGGEGSWIFTNAGGTGYSFRLYPTVHHTACPSQMEYYKIPGAVSTTCSGKAKVSRLVKSNYISSDSSDVNVDKARGLSIWIPTLITGPLPTTWEMDNYRHLRFARDTYWDEFLLLTMTQAGRSEYLSYDYLEEKAADLRKYAGTELEPQMYESLKMEMELNMISDHDEDVQQFVQKYSQDPSLLKLCREFGQRLGDINKIREKTAVPGEE